MDEGWHVVWIDHSRALGFDPRRAKNPKMPRRFDRVMVERLTELDKGTLQKLSGDLFPRRTINSVLRQRHRILEEVEAAIER